MDSEPVEEILRSLKKKCTADDREILFFIDDAPSHAKYFLDTSV